MLRRMVDAPVPGKRWREDRKRGGKTHVKNYMESMESKVKDVLDKKKGRQKFKTIQATPDDGKHMRRRSEF